MLATLLCLLLSFRLSVSASEVGENSNLTISVDNSEFWNWLADRLEAKPCDEEEQADDASSLSSLTFEEAHFLESSTLEEDEMPVTPNTPDSFNLTEARALANKLLRDRCNECTGILRPYIPWSKVKVIGSPPEINRLQPNYWCGDELKAFFKAYSDITFVEKEKSPCVFGKGFKGRRKFYDHVRKALIELQLMSRKETNVPWKKVFKKFPTLKLTSSDYRRWNEADKESLHEHIISPYEIACSKL